MGLYILAEIRKLDKLDPGIYRDDFLAVTSATPRQGEKLKQKIIQIFAKHGLGTTALANMRVVDFLDITFDLEEGTFKPFCKPGNIPIYVHKQSNHPPAVIKRIPENVNHRLSSISSDEKMFKTAAPQYQESINKSGYNYTLRFDPNASVPKAKQKNRKRHVLWYNPPFNCAVITNVAREFLKLIDECFPPYHPLHKIFNRKNVKVGYSTTPNIAQIIAAKNSKILKPPEIEKRKCNCPKNNECPLDNKCLSEGIIYQATVTQPEKEPKTYIGLCSTDFKARLGVHRDAIRNPHKKNIQTSLSKHVDEIHKRNIEPNITWKLIDKGKTFSPVSQVCQLCTREAFYIIFHPESATLNTKSEIFSACRHKKSKLLFPPERGRKKSPGT